MIKTPDWHQSMYDSDEIKQIFAAAGLVDVQIFGGFDGRPFVRGETTHPIYIGRTTS